MSDVEYKVGDRVVLKDTYSDAWGPLKVGKTYPITAIDSDDTVRLNDEWWVNTKDIAPESAVKVGDKVKYRGDTSSIYLVLAIDGDTAWVKDVTNDLTNGARYSVAFGRLIHPEPEKWVVGVSYDPIEDKAWYKIKVIAVDEDGDAWVKYDDGSKGTMEEDRRVNYTVA